MIRLRFPTTGMLLAFACGSFIAGCSSEKPSLSEPQQPVKSSSASTRQTGESASKAARKDQFDKMQDSIHAVASLSTSQKGPEFDFKFVMPSDDWEQVSHGTGDRKSSVWLFKLKKNGLKILVSCAGEKESPEFSKSAQQVFDSSKKRQSESTREWRVGNFVIRRSFIGYIDDRHGETTLTAFSPLCALEFNVASDSLDREELFLITDKVVEDFIKRNPTGGFPSK